MRPANALRFYRVRLRARAAQEGLAIIGIAAGVALLFASQVSSSSLQGSVAELQHGLVGNATLQLLARGPQGLPASDLARVRRLAGVRVAAPLVEAAAQVSGPHGSRAVELIGADESLQQLGGTLVPHEELTPFGGIGAVVLAAPLAHAVGVVRFGQEVTLSLAGRTVQAPLYAQLGERRIGPLARSPVVLAPLSYAQELAGLDGRVSRVLVETAPDGGVRTRERVRAELTALAAGRPTVGRVSVEPIDYESTLLANAATASSQSSALFAAISALVGFLFAFNATLLTAPARRRLIVELRRDGYARRTAIAVLCLDALVLGVLASALGLVLGYELYTHALSANSSFFALAFTVGSERSVGFADVTFATGGGMLAAFAAVLLGPLPAIVSRDPLAAAGGESAWRGRWIGSRGGGSSLRGGSPGARGGASAAGWVGVGVAMFAVIVCLTAAGILLAAKPDDAIPGMVLVIGALLCMLPLVLSGTIALARKMAGLLVGPVPHVAWMELSAGRARAMAIAATGAVAVFGSVAIQGAQRDLLTGLHAAARETTSVAQVWVAPVGSYDMLLGAPLSARVAARTQAELRHLAQVRSVGPYRGGLLDYGRRRVLVIAPPLTARALLPAGQLLGANTSEAERRVRDGGWIVLARSLAAEHHLHVGQTVILPTPDPTPMRVAALSTNIGWEPGAIVMSSASYARAWGGEASAYAIGLAPGVTPPQGARAIRRALASDGQGGGLVVQTARQRAAAEEALATGTLAQLTQIATLIPIFAVLAMAAAIGAIVWQRRPRLAKLKLEGLARAQLWRTILLENLLLLGAGCATGALFGLYAWHLADSALTRTIDFPVAHSLSPLPALTSLALVIATALAVLALPGYLAAGVPAAVALQEE